MRVDALESALRRLRGVRYVAIAAHDASTMVQVLPDPKADADAIRKQASEICEAHLAGAFVLDVGSTSRPSRVQLLDVEVGNEDQVVVHLGYDGICQSGRSRGSDPSAAAEATFEALANLGAPVPFRVEAAALFEHAVGEGVMVVLGSETSGPRFGVASGSHAAQAAVRATLHALNRYLATQSLAGGRPV